MRSVGTDVDPKRRAAWRKRALRSVGTDVDPKRRASRRKRALRSVGTNVDPRRRAKRAMAAVVGVGLLVACGAGSPGPAAPDAEVVAVVDGDTISVRSDGVDEQVRLIGIDTPEVAHHGNPAECHGPEASARLAELLAPGTVVRLRRDQEARDAYGRLLAYVISADGTVVNLQLVAEGHARPLAIPPNLLLADAVAEAAAGAQRAGLGLWSRCRPGG